jgi:hypothetical protein
MLFCQCCTIPAVHSDYTPKGTYKSLGKLTLHVQRPLRNFSLVPHTGAFQKVYVTGPEKSDSGIIAVFDIFG